MNTLLVICGQFQLCASYAVFNIRRDDGVIIAHFYVSVSGNVICLKSWLWPAFVKLIWSDVVLSEKRHVQFHILAGSPAVGHDEPVGCCCVPNIAETGQQRWCQRSVQLSHWLPLHHHEMAAWQNNSGCQWSVTGSRQESGLSQHFTCHRFHVSDTTG